MIFVALSANLPSRFGEPPQTFSKAIHILKEDGIICVKASDIWLTSPVPVSDQPWYYNAVVQMETDKSPEEMLLIMKQLEMYFGTQKIHQNDARLLDLDLIAYNGIHLVTDDLTVPHPRMHGRAFVLEPLQQIAPDWIHPVLKKTISDMLQTIPADQKAKIHGAIPNL